jgi:uncharacterized protein (TIGR03083 family)
VQLGDHRILPQRTQQGMLARTGADDEDAHGHDHSRCATGATAPDVLWSRPAHAVAAQARASQLTVGPAGHNDLTVGPACHSEAMPTSLTFDDHLAVISGAADALFADARDAALTDQVPTCPGWTVADLLGHHGGVCRWATAIVGEGRTGNLTDAELATAMAAPAGRRPLLDWYRAATAGLVAALKEPGPEPRLVFLPDAPAPREFWARRSAHETTVHRVDMLAATLGHVPLAGSTGVGLELALDGLDELLMGFVPRPSSALRADEPIVATVEPNDAKRSWTVRIDTGPPVSSAGSAAHPDATLTGSASALYLGLWNRGDEIAEHGDAPVLGLWREKMRVQWS